MTHEKNFSRTLQGSFGTYSWTLSGLKLPQKSREKSLLPPAGLGRSEILAGRSEMLAVAETRREFPHQLLLYCLCLLFIYFHPIYIQCCVLFKFFIFTSTFGVNTVLELSLFSNILPWNTVKSDIFVGHLISFISWVNKIHEIKCQRKYLFPIHFAGFIENQRN